MCPEKVKDQFHQNSDHNLFGVASMGAATAMIQEGKLKGTVRFYGTPAEEKFFGKLWMVREGLSCNMGADAAIQDIK